MWRFIKDRVIHVIHVDSGIIRTIYWYFSPHATTDSNHDGMPGRSLIRILINTNVFLDMCIVNSVDIPAAIRSENQNLNIFAEMKRRTLS